MKQLTSQGNRVHQRQAELIKEEEHETLCKVGVQGHDTLRKLVDTLLYFFRIHFALRASKEHRQLIFENSQVSIQTDSDGSCYLLYREDVSKNRQGGLQHRKKTPKYVHAYEKPENPNRCSCCSCECGKVCLETTCLFATESCIPDICSELVTDAADNCWQALLNCSTKVFLAS